MKSKVALGLAMISFAFVFVDGALSENIIRRRFVDPDLIALEKLGARAKRAMEAFVLRPRVPDSYDYICSGCMRDADGMPLPRLTRTSIHIPQSYEANVTKTSDLTRRRSISKSTQKYVKYISRFRKKLAFRAYKIKRNMHQRLKPEFYDTWEAELRR